MDFRMKNRFFLASGVIWRQSESVCFSFILHGHDDFTMDKIRLSYGGQLCTFDHGLPIRNTFLQE